MARTLNVWFAMRQAGRLTQDDSGRLLFAYEPSYLAERGAWPLSVSLPLRVEPFDDRATRPFFSGLLPEEEIRRKIAELVG